MIRRCSCGALHHWHELPIRGVQRVDPQSDEYAVEVRNCTVCRSTLSVPLALAKRDRADRDRCGADEQEAAHCIEKS